jgi:RNA polymerase sigma-70 factor (ECF subfamily)
MADVVGTGADADRERADRELSIVIRNAARGEPGAVAAIVERLTPALLMQAEHRLGAALRRFVEPQDVVNDVWLSALRRLPEFRADTGRAVPSLLAYLGVAVLRRVLELHKRHIDGKPFVRTADAAAESGSDALAADIAATATGAVTAAVRAERGAALRAAIDALDETDRAVVVLRGVEAQDLEVVAMLTGLTPNGVSQRYRRALAKLRERLPASVFDELDAA